MANKVLKGLTVQIGGDTSELLDSLKDVEKKGGDLSKELGQINKLLKFDPKNTELLAQKQKVLGDAIKNTEGKLDKLKEAEKQAQAQFAKGEISEQQYRALQREIVETEQKLDKYKKAAKETADAVEDLGDEAKDTGKKVEDMGDQSKEAERDTSSFGDSLGKVTAAGLAAVAAAAVGAAAGIKSVVESTAEYRQGMAKLDTAFEKSGHSSETAYKTYAELQSVLGETDQAIEAANFLAKLADNEQDLAKWTEVCTGIYGEFGTSLPIESLTEAANETAKVGQVTGAFADALNWGAVEGETFGVAMKKNISFTKLTEKELAKLSKTQRAEYEAREAQFTTIDEWNKAVSEAASAEDFFNLALQECTTEQERQTLILDTLNGIYGESAGAFRENNEEVIKQNEASEKLNATWAKVGQKAAPIVTAFTEGLAELAEAFLELLEDADIDALVKGIESGFKKLTNNVLPKLIKALEWCAENWDILKSVAVGFLAALAVSKIASFATTIYSKLVPALAAGTSGQMAMNAAAYANPYVLLAAAITAVAVAFGTYYQAQLDKAKEKSYEATKAVHGLTEAEIEVAKRATEAGEAFRNQRKAFDDTVSSINSQFSHLDSLKDELFNLVDASGKVKDADKARVDFILDQLNDAMGTEYERVGDLIQGYKDLKLSIEDALLAKKTELLLEAGGDAYAEAVRKKQQTEADYAANLKAYEEAKVQRDRLLAEYYALKEEYDNANTFQKGTGGYAEAFSELTGEFEAINEVLKETGPAYKDSREALLGYYTDIGQYETAQRFALEGNTAEAERIMSDRGYYMEKYADKYAFESDQVMNSMEMEVIEAGNKAKLFKENWENGVEGYSHKMVNEAEAGYREVLGQYADAYDDAVPIGEDLANGMIEGAENRRETLIGKAWSLVDSFFNAVAKASDTHSPSRRAIAMFEQIGAGAEIGVENKTEDVAHAGVEQVDALMDAYKGQEIAAQRSLQNIATLQTERMLRDSLAANSTSEGLLERILVAIENGHEITIDGEALVGATSNRMDNALGRRRALAARGAI